MEKETMMSLIREGSSIRGMFNEIKWKINLLRDRISLEQITEDEVDSSILQMKEDLDRYNKRFYEICQELENYGIVSEF